MSVEFCLDGRVRKVSLPVFRSPPETDAPLLKRLLLPNGELAQFTDGAEPLRYVAAVELRAGGIRGNHYHLHKHESLYVFSGTLTLFLGDPASGARSRMALSAGDLAMIPPGIAHALQVLQPGIAIEFAPQAFNPADTYPFGLV